jgi:hypothetical protein
VRATKIASPLIVLLPALCLGVMLPGIAAAALGEQESSVQEDAARVQGSIKIQERALYRMHEIKTPSGTVVREFVSSAGAVFAVAWTGPVMPNLRQTLGKYFDPYVAAVQRKNANHRRVEVHQDDLVVEAGGHMRAYSGRAYLPQAVPSGVNIGDLH